MRQSPTVLGGRQVERRKPVPRTPDLPVTDIQNEHVLPRPRYGAAQPLGAGQSCSMRPTFAASMSAPQEPTPGLPWGNYVA